MKACDVLKSDSDRLITSTMTKNQTTDEFVDTDKCSSFKRYK